MEATITDRPSYQCLDKEDHSGATEAEEDRYEDENFGKTMESMKEKIQKESEQ